MCMCSPKLYVKRTHVCDAPSMKHSLCTPTCERNKVSVCKSQSQTAVAERSRVSAMQSRGLHLARNPCDAHVGFSFGCFAMTSFGIRALGLQTLDSKSDVLERLDPLPWHLHARVLDVTVDFRQDALGLIAGLL